MTWHMNNKCKGNEVGEDVAGSQGMESCKTKNGSGQMINCSRIQKNHWTPRMDLRKEAYGELLHF
jgi:hypothetical protein